MVNLNSISFSPKSYKLLVSNVNTLEKRWKASWSVSALKKTKDRAQETETNKLLKWEY